MRMAWKIWLGFLAVAIVAILVSYAIFFLAQTKDLASWQALIIDLCLTILVTGLGGLYYSRNITSDLKRLISSARRISQGDLTQ